MNEATNAGRIDERDLPQVDAQRSKPWLASHLNRVDQLRTTANLQFSRAENHLHGRCWVFKSDGERHSRSRHRCCPASPSAKQSSVCLRHVCFRGERFGHGCGMQQEAWRRTCGSCGWTDDAVYRSQALAQGPKGATNVDSSVVEYELECLPCPSCGSYLPFTTTRGREPGDRVRDADPFIPLADPCRLLA